MPGDERQLGMRELAVNYVEVGATNAAGMYADRKLAATRVGEGERLLA